MIKIYTTPTCAYCKMAKRFLNTRGIQYEEIDVSADENGAKKLLAVSGQLGVPVMQFDQDSNSGQVILGFDEPAIIDAIKSSTAKSHSQ